MEYLHTEITAKIIASYFEVHSNLQQRVEKEIYCNALKIEMIKLNLEVTQNFSQPIFYKTEKVGEQKLDFLIENKVGIFIDNNEIKINESEILSKTKAYCESILQLSKLEIIMLLNFGIESEFKRLFLSNHLKKNLSNFNPTGNLN